jgi:phage terminase large subunit-like protein
MFGDPLGSDSEVVYIGVDREQAKRNAWNMLKNIARDMGVFVRAYENTNYIVVNNGINDCRIRLLGMDRPDAARGMKLRYAVLDEYADMPENVWGEVIRPALMDCRGGAMFIGTPKGKNHFYKLFVDSLTGEAGELWEAFNFQSHDNSTLHCDELETMAHEYAKDSPELYEQEIEGKFIASGGTLFHTDDFIIDPEEPNPGTYFITVDLAGFSRESTKKTAKISRLDNSAIVINKCHMGKDVNDSKDVAWWIKDIEYGKWGVEETARRIIDAAIKYSAETVGIERGALFNAVEPYLEAEQRRRRKYLNIVPLTHGNTKKYDRIQWGLQGRAKRGLIRLNPGPWNSVLIEEAVDFPSRLTHDDLLDALAYQDQIADYVDWNPDMQQTDWEPLDPTSGY